MINLGDAVLFFKGDMNDLDRALGEARAAAEDSMGNIKQLAQEAGMAMTAMGAAITGALGFAVTDFANTGDEVNDLSKKIGFSTETVSKWAFALGQSGGDMSLLQTGVRGLANQIDSELNKAMSDTGEVADGTSSAFQRIGVDAAALKALAPEDQFMRVALAVAAVQDPMERAALAQDMFGRGGMDLLPVLSEGEAGLRAMFDQAERAGAVFSQEQADMADAYNDALGELSASAAGAGKELAVVLIPSLISTIGWVKENVIAFKDWAQTNPETAASLVTMAGSVGVFMAVAGPLLIMLPGIVTAVGLVGPAFGLVGAAIVGVAGAIMSPIGLMVGAVAAIGFIAWDVYENWEQVKEALANTWEAIIGVFEYGIAAIGEYSGWIAANIVQAFTDPVAFVMEYWQGLGEFFYSIFEWIGSGVDLLMTNIIDPIWNKLAEFYDWLTGVFSGAFDDAWNIANGLLGGGTEQPQAFARGTRNAPGGMAWVGEEGPELMYVPRGAQVYPAQQSAAMAGGGATVSINIGSVSLPSRAAIQEFNRGLGDEVARRLSARGMQPRIA